MVEPPSIGQSVQSVFRIVDVGPCIATDSAAVGIVGREERSNRKIYPEFAVGYFIDIFHPFIVGLHACCNLRIEMRIRLVGAVGHEVDFNIFIAPVDEFLKLAFDAGFHSRMSGVEGISSVKLKDLSVAIKICILEFIFGHLPYHGFGILSPVGERTIIDTGLLTILFALLHKLTVLLRLETEIPESVESDIDHSVVIERFGLQFLVEEIGHLHRLVIIDLCLEFSPAVPSEGATAARFNLGSHFRAGISESFHSVAPVGITSHEDERRFHDLPFHCSMRNDISCKICCDSAVSHESVECAALVGGNLDSGLPGVVFDRAYHEGIASIGIHEGCGLITVGDILAEGGVAVSHPCVIVVWHKHCIVAGAVEKVVAVVDCHGSHISC